MCPQNNQGEHDARCIQIWYIQRFGIPLIQSQFLSLYPDGQAIEKHCQGNQVFFVRNMSFVIFKNMLESSSRRV